MAVEIQITNDLIASDALFILHSVALAEKELRKLPVREARETIANALTLNFNDCVRFLKQFGYLEIDEDEAMVLTPAGVEVIGGAVGELPQQTQSYFAHKIGESAFGFEYIPPAPGEFFDLIGLIRREPTREPETTPSAKPQEAASSYVRGEVIGRGPIGRVIRSQHAALNVVAALKEVSPPSALAKTVDPALFTSRLKREVGAQSRLQHPAIVTVHDLDLSGTPTIVSELCEGGNLRQRVMSPAPLTIEQTLLAFMQLFDGLALAEAEGLSHGNIKPENVLFDRYGNAKLSDFGLARLTTDPTGDERQKDICALGSLLYIALTRRPHNINSPFASRLVPGIPTAIDWVIDRMTTDSPKERYKTVAELQEAFFNALANSSLGQPGRFVVLTAVIDEDLRNTAT